VAAFPALKTGAVAQYPSDRIRRHSTEVYRFVDGTEQRFPNFGAGLKRWAIRLDLLDEAELTAVESLFTAEGGRAAHFSFTDPWDGTVHADCSFDTDELSLEFLGPARGRLQVIVKENR
jgi:hypothetical protein